MPTPITIIKPGEQSDNVAALHAAMRIAGLTVDPAEVRERRAGPSTQWLVREFQARMKITPSKDLLVDEATAKAINDLLARAPAAAEDDLPYIVEGSVTTPGGGLARGYGVVAFDQDLRKREELGRAAVDARGNYFIRYTSSSFARAEKGSADLVIEVHAPAGELLYTSDVAFNAPLRTRIDVKLRAFGTEAQFDRIVRELTPLLDGQDVTLATLEEGDEIRDISFAAEESGQPRDGLLDFAVAQRLLLLTQIDAEFWFAVLRTHAIPGVPFADEPPNLAAAAQAVLDQAHKAVVANVESAVKGAIDANIIDKHISDRVAAWMDSFRKLIGGAIAKTDGPGTKQHVVDVAGVSGSKQDELVRALAEGGTRTDVLQRVRDSKTFSDTEAARIENALLLHDLTLGDPRLVRQLQQHIDSPAGAAALAKLTPADWQSAIESSGTIPPAFVAGEKSEQTANFAALLSANVRQAFPTTAFAGDLARALDAKQTVPFGSAPEIRAFLYAHPDFDLATTSVAGYLRTKAPGTATPAFVADLKAVQRVYKLAPSFDATSTLLASGIHSAQQIYRMGRSKFVGRFGGAPGFTEAAAADTFERAASTQAAATTIVGELRTMRNAEAVQTLNSASSVQVMDFAESASTDFPNLLNLFGSADACACDDCRSIFSAAAYLADILMYLGERDAIAAGVTVRDVLFSRRPDIGYIELSCENTNTPMPYVDLACEVLEDRVAPWKLFDLDAITVEPHLVQGFADSTVIQAFHDATPSVALAAGATVSAKDKLGNWVIRDIHATYLVVKNGARLDVSLSRQTRGTAEELAAAPEYVNDAAYALLRTAVYPLALPFDLSAEEIRGYLDKAGAKRSELMELFRGPNAPNNPGDLDIAAEFLGIAKAEQALIFTADALNEFRYWGEPDNPTALADLTKVDVFLNRTGIEYNDLLRLLTLGFINPGNKLFIHHLDSTCDASAKRIEPVAAGAFDADALDRFHRFLRLWRRLGWKSWEIDLVIRHPKLGGGALGASLATNLYPLLQLRARFTTLDVEQLCAFFDVLNTAAKFTEPFKKADPSLYEKLFLNKRLMNPLDAEFAVDKVLAGAEDIDNHIPPILAALRITAAELAVFRTLPGITGKLTLDNLSKLYRNATLAKLLRFKAAEWKTLLAVANRDPFASTAAALVFVNLVDRIRGAGFSVDQLDHILAADPNAKAVEPEKTVTSALTTLRKTLQSIVAANDPSIIAPDAEALSAAIAAQLQSLGWPADAAQQVIDVFSDRVVLRSAAATLPGGFSFPASVRTAVPGIAYDDATRTIAFTGIMTGAQQTILLTSGDIPAPIRADVNYQNAINELHDLPFLLIKFQRPLFRTTLPVLPATVDFGSQLPRSLAGEVAYDSERRELTFFGTMTIADRAALTGVSADPAFLAAVGALYTLPRTGTFPPGELWLASGDLVTPLPDHLVENLTLGEQRLAAYVVRTLSREQVFDQLATALQITSAIAERLLTGFSPFGHPLLDDYTAPVFVNSTGAITPIADPNQNAGYHWLHRVALVSRTLKMTFADTDFIIRRQAETGVIDLAQIPTAPSTPAAARLDELLRLADFMNLHHTTSNAALSMLDVIERIISDGTYTNDKFAADAETLAGWPAADVQSLTNANVLDLAYPAAYRQIDAWLRIDRAVGMILRLGGTATVLLKLANPAAGADESNALKSILRSKLDDQGWLDLSKIIQDKLRDRKRDSLVAYLLTEPMPANAPTHKWDDANDLFAYCLIDVEMTSCQLTSRIVQGSGAVQLFVQRAFMGIEPEVRVSVEEHEEWSQWSWMKYYRVWEANRRVFAYPENYAEPELRLDKSELFKDLENELLQNEINRDTVETAFLHYVEKLDGIAQLEIAGTWYQENTKTLHVFGRTPGSEPRTYYYRQFIDGRRWTPWSKVECDIKGDSLVPLVANERLHLVWPEFRENAAAPDRMDIPTAGAKDVPLDQPQKKLDVHLAITEYRNGKWAPKKVSEQPVNVDYYASVTPEHFAVLPIDFTWAEGGPFLLMIYAVTAGGAQVIQAFELAGCRGYPEPFNLPDTGILVLLTRFQRDDLRSLKNVEVSIGNELVPQSNMAMTDEILALTPDYFRISYPHYMSFFDQQYVMAHYGKTWNEISHGNRLIIPLGTLYDWFYADKLRTFFVRQEYGSGAGRAVMHYSDLVHVFEQIGKVKDPRLAKEILARLRLDARLQLRFYTFYHPLTCLFAKQLYSKGVEGLMARETQFADRGMNFIVEYLPQAVVDPHFPTEGVDFDADGSYSSYNWELFFHAPLMVATQLSKDQRFEDAMRWFHFIFDPTGGHDKDPLTHLPAPAPQKYWITKPFYLHTADDYKNQRLETLMNLLATDPSTIPDPQVIADLVAQVRDWRQHPFDPHLVAQYRTVAYQKMTVMKYIDNLIAWGDQSFQLDTMEAVNIATQLYVLADEILGPRPRTIPPAARPVSETFNELEKKLDAFSDAFVELENMIPAMPGLGSGSGAPPPPIPALLYFCVPQNDKLLGYWDLVADRLYKIRHCLDLQGVYRQLPLFAPQIDPAALVRAAAAGVDIGRALAELDAPLPFYRFTTMLQKANEFTADVKALGTALLSALEKKDAEALALLRQSQEIAVLQAAREIKQKQIDDAQFALDGLQKNKELVTIRRDYYANREFMNAGEIAAAALTAASIITHTAGTIADVLAGVMFLIPDFKVGASGFGGTPHVAVEVPAGTKIGQGTGRGANGLYNIATILDKSAAISSTLASYQRRQDDWQLQTNLANKELEQIDKQIASAQLKVEIAQKDLANQDLQIANARAIDAFMHDKYTNQDLYQWMLGQISQTYFQSYQLAVDTARRAERCYRYEIGVADSGYIQYGYWDSLKKGLMAGERLQVDLRRLESAYLDQNRRELECTSHVSLALVNAQALLDLRTNGWCEVALPEELFDLDYAGHYFRRIKSVSLTIPCVAGPNTTVSCTLRLLSNSIRVTSTGGAQYERNNNDGVPADDDRFRESHVRVKSIATSSAQNDSGMFELNFRDERYLPFEGAGAISRWQLELSKEPVLRQFDYGTISDVILHVRYTAREDAGSFKNAAVQHLKDIIAGTATQMPLMRLFDLQHEFPNDWYAMLHPATGTDKVMHMKVRKQHFPYIAQEATAINLQKLSFLIRTDSSATAIAVQMTAPVAQNVTLSSGDVWHHGVIDAAGTALDETQSWSFTLATTAAVEEGYVVAEYTLS